MVKKNDPVKRNLDEEMDLMDMVVTGLVELLEEKAYSHRKNGKNE